MKVSKLMSTEVVTLGVDDPLVTAEELMGLRRFRHLPVVQGNKLVGLVTHKDLLRAALNHGSHRDRLVMKARTLVREVMKTKVATATPDTPVAQAVTLMVEHKYGCLPIVEDGVLVGILTEADFLMLVRAMLEHASPELMQKLEGSIRS